MKRASIAELTLKKQIDNCRNQEQEYLRQINLLQAQKDAVWNMRQQLEAERTRLENARIKASERFTK